MKEALGANAHTCFLEHATDLVEIECHKSPPDRITL
jgi:hypothetical protein